MRISDWSSDVCSSDLPFDIADHHLIVTASMGIAVAPQDGRDRDEILQHADMALYQAKHGGRNRYSLFEWSMKERLHRVREIEARSEERRAGKEWVSTCRSRWSAYHATTTNNH